MAGNAPEETLILLLIVLLLPTKTACAWGSRQILFFIMKLFKSRWELKITLFAIVPEY
jgi:hypothetical protein